MALCDGDPLYVEGEFRCNGGKTISLGVTYAPLIDDKAIWRLSLPMCVI